MNISMFQHHGTIHLKTLFTNADGPISDGQRKAQEEKLRNFSDSISESPEKKRNVKGRLQTAFHVGLYFIVVTCLCFYCMFSVYDLFSLSILCRYTTVKKRIVRFSFDLLILSVPIRVLFCRL